MPERTLAINPLSNTGILVSEIGLGTVKFGRNTGVKYPSSFSIPDDQTLRDLLDHAHELGINLLDTAPAYGSSEDTLGRLLNTDRDYWVISTKVGEYYQNQVSTYDFSRNRTISSVEDSCRKLKVEALDIVFVHSDGNDEEIATQTDVLPALLDLKQQGKIRAIGFSGKTVAGSKLALPHCDVFMITLNQSDLSQVELIEQCQQTNKGVIIKKALDSGHSANPAQALQFVSKFPGVSSTIIGTINPSHLAANVSAVIDA